MKTKTILTLLSALTIGLVSCQATTAAPSSSNAPVSQSSEEASPKAYDGAHGLRSQAASNNVEASIKHTVTFLDAYGNPLVTEEVPDGGTAVFNQAWPEKNSPDDTAAYYFFKGWDKPLANIKGDTTFTPVFGKADMSGVNLEQGSDGSYALQSGLIQAFGFNSDEEDVYLPRTYKGKAITAINTMAIYAPNAKTIHIPSTYKKLAENFLNYTYAPNLQTIEVDPANADYASVDGIVYSKDQTKLLKVPPLYPQTILTLPETVTLVQSFSMCNLMNVETVVFPKGLVRIDDDAISGATGDSSVDKSSIKSLVLNEGLESVGYRAVYHLPNLESLTLPSTLKETSAYAFGSNSGLKSVTVEEGVTELMEDIFNDSKSLTDVKLPSTLTKIGDRAFYQCPALSTIAIPAGVISIGEMAFYQDTSLSSVVLPDGLKSIGSSAFSYTALTSVELPKGLESLATDAFSSISALKDITVSKDNPTMSATEGLILSDKGKTLDLVTSAVTGALPTTVETVKAQAAYLAKFPKAMDLSHVKTFEKSAFSASTGLGDINLASAVSVGENAFDGTRGVDSIAIPGTVKEIGKNAFSNTSAATVTIGEGVTDLPESAFSQMGNFGDNLRLSKVTLPSTLTSIGKNAFYLNGKLTSIDLPEGLISIGSDAFSFSGLTEVTIPSTVTTLGSSAFGNISDLTKADIQGKLTAIPSRLFDSDSALTSVTLPSTVEKIGDGAFSSTPKLTQIDFENLPNLQYIGNQAFSSYSGGGLAGDIVLPDKVVAIGDGAFSGLTGITSITLPASLLSLGTSGVFPDTLTKLVFKGTKAQWAKVAKGYSWVNTTSSLKEVQCSDGTVPVTTGASSSGNTSSGSASSDTGVSSSN